MLQPLAGGRRNAQQPCVHLEIFPFVVLTASEVHVQSLQLPGTSIAQRIIAVRALTELHSNFDRLHL